MESNCESDFPTGAINQSALSPFFALRHRPSIAFLCYITQETVKCLNDSQVILSTCCGYVLLLDSGHFYLHLGSFLNLSATLLLAKWSCSIWSSLLDGNHLHNLSMGKNYCVPCCLPRLNILNDKWSWVSFLEVGFWCFFGDFKKTNTIIVQLNPFVLHSLRACLIQINVILLDM